MTSRMCSEPTCISIHALRAEGDAGAFKLLYDNCISIHALRAEGDRGWIIGGLTMKKFLSTPSVRRATRTSARR